MENGSQKIICPICGSEEVLTGKKWCICDECGERFLNNAAENNKLLKLFISYSHTEEEICQEIVEALRERGHNVWFDREKIYPGTDWRNEIAKGILSSNGVIAFLSSNSVRDPGVCLNELSIAIGVRGGNIKTVLLEPEKRVLPPASISHIQWLDMSTWREEKRKGREVFRKWFDEKMAELFLVVESQENRAFSGQISMIRSKLPLINYDDSKQRNLLLQPFIGRSWLTEKIEKWLNDRSAANLCVLYGDPGIGKSAFAANYGHYNDKVIASIFCEYNKMNFTKSQEVIQTLAFLLACRMPEYRTILVEVLNNTLNIGEYNASDMFDLLLTTPLSRYSIDGEHETVCIVIDGLDECGDFSDNPLAEILSQYAPRFPSWIRILLTARKVASVQYALRGIPVVDICGNTTENMEDVDEYFKQLLSDYIRKNKCPDNFTKILSEKSHGIFLYAKIISQAFLEGKMTLDNMESLPDGIANAFYKWFGWFFDDVSEYHERYRLPLGVLAASPEPIPVAEYVRLFQWDENEIDDFLRRIGILLRKERNILGQETIALSHKYLKDWLDSESAGNYRSQKVATYRYMGNVFYRMYSERKNILSEYEILYMFSFLSESRQEELLMNLTKTPDFFMMINSAGDKCLEKGYIHKAWQFFCAADDVALFCKRYSDAPDIRLMYSISKLKLAEVHEIRGELKKSLALYEECYNIRVRLNEERGNYNDRKCLGVSCERMASLYLAAGEIERAKEFLFQGLVVREKLNKERGNIEDIRNLGSNCQLLAEVYEAEGNNQEAGRLFKRCYVLRREQVSESVDANDWKDLGVAMIRLSSFELREGNLERTAELIESLDGVINRLSNEMDNSEIARVVSYCHAYHGELLRAKGQDKKAEEQFSRAIEIRKKLVADRGAKEDLWNLGGAYFMLANMKFSSGEYQRARELIDKILKIDEELAASRGKDGDYKGIAYCHLMLGKISMQIEDMKQAGNHLEKAFVILEKFYKKRNTFDDREDLAAVLHHLSKVYYHYCNYEKAEEYCDRALELRKYQVEHRGLCDDFKFYGASCLVKCQFHIMWKEYEQAEILYMNVFDMDSDNMRKRGSAADVDCLCMACIQIAEFYLLVREKDKGIVFSEQALSIAKEHGQEARYYERAYAVDRALKSCS